MGSFYTKCSVTNKTIVDGMSTTVQFMVPNKFESPKYSTSSMLADLVLRTVEKSGIDEAKKMIDSRKDTDFLAPKGLIVSNNPALDEWIPFGPAIKGKYDDYGRIAPDMEDPENVRRIETLKRITGLEFESLQEVASDNRWYTLGVLENKETWQVKGVNDLSPDRLELAKQLSLTFFHTPVHEILCAEETYSNPDPSEYDIKWRNEYMDGIIGGVLKQVDLLIRTSSDNDEDRDSLRDEFELKYSTNLARTWLSEMSPENQIFILAGMVQEIIDLEDAVPQWFMENSMMIYNLSGIGLPLRQSLYGSQSENWYVMDMLNNSIEYPIYED